MTLNRQFEINKLNIFNLFFLVKHGEETKFAWKCGVCGKIFIGRIHIDQHINLYHEGLDKDKDNKYVCQICCRGFFWPTSFKRHILIHSGEQPYQCEECGRRFSQKSSLDRHTNVHLVVKKFRCDRCPKSFSRLDGLRRHRMRICESDPS